MGRSSGQPFFWIGAGCLIIAMLMIGGSPVQGQGNTTPTPTGQPPLKPGSYELSLRMGKLERKYVLYIPKGYDGTKALPLVVILHGAGGTGKGALTGENWDAKADKEGFIAVAPDATAPNRFRPANFLTNPQYWNDGSGRGSINHRDVDDVGFIKTLIDVVGTKANMDTQRLYITGFSSGASMTARLGIEIPEKVAAIAPVSGQFFQDQKPALAIPVLYMIGTTDPLNPFDGGKVKLPFPGAVEETKPPISELVQKWVKLLECPTEPSTIVDKDGVKAVKYGPCKDNAEFVFYTIDGLGHIWPGGKNELPERIVGKPTDKLNATDVIWDFFQAHPKKK